ncbi:MAG: zinc-dependent metalloprotease [Chitinophagaceae bacterium]
MRTSALLAGIACTFFSFALQAQQKGCGFELLHHKMMQANSHYKNAVQQYEQQVRSAAPEARISGSTYIMPVVFHIVHTGDTLGSVYNPTDAQIQSVVDYLNNVYAGTDAGLMGESTGDIGIRFELAKRDPNCNATNGINHINGSSLPGYVAHGVNVANTNGTPDVTLKNFIRWDPTKYCNIWVVNKIDDNDGEFGGGTGGYAYFPFDPTIDGVVVRVRDLYPGSTLLPHEIGHVFTLYHPFEGSNGSVCPPNANPSTDGDMIADTDPVTNPNFADPERTGSTNPCTGTAYTIATEHNIMSYVLNARLFTAGQKTRMRAGATNMYRLGQINSSGDIAPDEGTACTPKINFEWTEFQATEQTATSVVSGGCTRGYKDYTFNMVIGSNPTAAATATLQVSGTAQEGVDYDITTNGSFTAPSKVVTFPAGAHASRSFTIRIYDDAIVETTETIILGMTVNNGGGNAVAGDGRPVETITIYDNDKAPFGPYDDSKQLNGTYNFASTVPFTARSYQYKSQFLYKATELIAAGVKAGSLTALSFDITKHSNSAFIYKNFTIKLGQTSQTFITDYVNHTGTPVSDGSLTTVYSGNYTTVNGTNIFTFSSPFTWNGTSNIVVTICFDNGSTVDPADDEVPFYSDDYSATNASFAYQFTNCATAFGTSPYYYNNNYKPVINLISHNNGTQVQTTLNGSRSEYLGPNADVYFYDQSNGSLLARVKNLSAFNYGCTQVVIDRSGTGATAYRDNTTSHYLMNKTFRVLPSVNNSSGQYEITLYYTQQEVNGWQTATGQSFSNIELVKVPGQISASTPANPNGAGTPQPTTPTKSMLGSNYALTATFNTGFSGFGAGMVSVALPVTLLDFSGRINNNDVSLYWQTTQEINNDYFVPERSTDGQQFTALEPVKGKGNSSLTIAYNYTDKQAALLYNNTLYYRLKQVDIDGKVSYSKVIALNTDKTGKITITPTPASNQLYLHTGNIAVAQNISLYSMNGQLIKQWLQHNPSEPLDISSVQPGIYLVKLQAAGILYQQKVIKQ